MHQHLRNAPHITAASHPVAPGKATTHMTRISPCCRSFLGPYAIFNSERDKAVNRLVTVLNWEFKRMGIGMQFAIKVRRVTAPGAVSVQHTCVHIIDLLLHRQLAGMVGKCHDS